MKYSIDEDEFRELISGKIVQIPGQGEIALKDIGYWRMSQIIREVADRRRERDLFRRIKH